ncbi:alanine acetyltransferase [Microtetraspora sp. NBRC 13810]|uniref:GNAT family N-acetyltransferase n=1 Tax=Microtetraspora sp. NBRC 13810 TaxID=3030990 RepID=UPI0024A0C624|nr:GNAT family protein [Microtetraspora sp. NBRC 13810]GLW13099.1 alanine acetyltransferase [Microtetraspora sp. NBRC 13810]
MVRVTLRPVVELDLMIFEREFYSLEGRGHLQWFGHRSPHMERRIFAETGYLGDDGGMLTVCSDDEVAGRVQWFKNSWGPPATSWCWTISILVRPAHQGNGVGTEAQRQLVAYLFEHTQAHRIQASTDIDNQAEQRALEKAGFRREGVLREAQWRGGRWHDQVLYSLLRTD